MSILRIGIATYEEMKRRTLAIARGKLKPSALDPKVWFTSPESFARVLSNRNRALLAVISTTRPHSLQELADRTGRKTSNLSTVCTSRRSAPRSSKTFHLQSAPTDRSLNICQRI